MAGFLGNMRVSNDEMIRQRCSCPLCDGENAELLRAIPNYPVFMGCVNHIKDEDKRLDQTWFLCTDCGCIYLRDLAPLSWVYPESHNAAVGQLWNKHHQEFAKFVTSYSPTSVLEIGGAHGILSREVKFLDSKIQWTIVEPNPVPDEGVDAKFIKGFFDEAFTLDSDIDAIVHSHVFEHMYDPRKFVTNLYNFLKRGQKLLFTLPNMNRMLEKKYTNCINFEHTIYLTEPYINQLLTRAGFQILEKKYYLEDHSIFYACEKSERKNESILPKGLIEENRSTFTAFIKYHDELIVALNNEIKRISSERPIFLFGAHVFSQFLIELGLNIDNVKCLLDNSIAKQGRRMYGTDFRVESPRILADYESPVVILKAGIYNEEIKSDILNNINRNVVFI